MKFLYVHVHIYLASLSAYYRIVLGKFPWVLAAQAPKIEGGQLHGGA